MATKTARTRPGAARDLLGIYLTDHLAGATAGAGLVRRMAGAADPGSQQAAVLEKLVLEIDADRAALLAVMTDLGVRPARYKVLGAWAGTQAGRLKLNGHLLSRSPLSDLEEAEILRLGVAGKAAGWRTLRVLADRDRRLDAGRLDQLLARAAGQEEVLENLRVAAAERVLAAAAAERPQ